jgi:predicted lipoprotein with Yx(FWY)xxD motif
MRHLGRWGIIAGAFTLLAATSAPAKPNNDDLPRGLSLIETDEGTVLAHRGKTVYRLQLDRIRRRYKGFLSFDVPTARCGDECAKYWIPLEPPADFKPAGSWTVTNPDTKPQLAYKDDPLYTFSGNSFAPLLQNRTAPSYFSGYTAKPGKMLTGVPVGTVYWQPVSYSRAVPEVAVPAGIKVGWSKSTFIFLSASDEKLYVRKSAAPCKDGCDGLKPLEAPMVAQPLGEWRPLRDDDTGRRFWTYRNSRVYFRSSGIEQELGADWKPLAIG